MKQCKCPNCGAPINTARMICEYCGTTFKEETGGPPYKPEIRYVMASPGVKTLGVEVRLSKEFLDVFPLAIDEVRRQMAREMAEKLVGEIEIAAKEDVCTRDRIFRARLRVLDPAFRF